MKFLGKTHIRGYGEKQSPKPYKTCRLCMIYTVTCQKRTRNHGKSIMFTRVHMCISCILSYLQKPLNSWLNLHFGRLRFRKKYLHWKSLNPFENLLRIHTSPCHLPRMTQNELQTPSKTLVKLILPHCIARAAETLIKPVEIYHLREPLGTSCGPAKPKPPPLSKPPPC